jgi:hypothetical protein
MATVDFTINGGYQPYVYVVLLQISILYLQRLDLNRRIRGEEGKTQNPSINFYYLATRFIATGLNWLSWLLAAYVGNEFGIASGILFLILGLGSSIIATVLIPPLPRIDLIAHVVSFPATVYLVRATLLALGIQTGF